jgi:hypothetical protein
MSVVTTRKGAVGMSAGVLLLAEIRVLLAKLLTCSFNSFSLLLRVSFRVAGTRRQPCRRCQAACAQLQGHVHHRTHVHQDWRRGLQEGDRSAVVRLRPALEGACVSFTARVHVQWQGF